MYTLAKLLFIVFGYETLTSIVPVGTFACAECGHVNDEFDPFKLKQ